MPGKISGIGSMLKQRLDHGALARNASKRQRGKVGKLVGVSDLAKREMRTAALAHNLRRHGVASELHNMSDAALSKVIAVAPVAAVDVQDVVAKRKGAAALLELARRAPPVKGWPTR